MASAIDASQLSPAIQQYILEQIAAQQAAKDAAGKPVQLTPQEELAQALATVHVQAQRERPSPAHNDHIVGAVVAYLDLLDAYVASITPASSVETPEESAPATSDVASAVEAAAPHAGD